LAVISNIIFVKSGLKWNWCKSYWTGYWFRLVRRHHNS